MKRDAVLNDRKKPGTDSQRGDYLFEIRISRKAYFVLIVVLILPYFAIAGFWLANKSSRPKQPATALGAASSEAFQNTEGTFAGSPGPWGSLTYVPISIETPEEYLSVRAFEATDPRWFFGGQTKEKAMELFGACELTADQRKKLGESKWDAAPNGVYVTPSTDLVLSLTPQCRRKLYSALAQFPENSSQQDVFSFPVDHFDDFFAKSSVAPQTLAMVKQLSYPHGRTLFFADLPLVLKTLPSHAEKLHLAKAVSRRSTMLLKMRITPETDVNAILNYWGKAGQEKDLRPLLESLTKVPGGTTISLVNLLPIWPAARLYTFPLPSTKPLEHDNCHWTTFNFFRDPPDDRYSEINFIKQKLGVDFYPVFSDPRYGDLVFLCKQNGEIIHSAVYLADDIVYTKNGGHFLSPWMLMKIPEMVDAFSAMLPENEQIKTLYYRNKYY